MKLNVPIIKQKEESLECGIACLNMIFNYYNVDFSYRDALKKIEIFNAGISVPQLGIYLEENGISTTIITMNPLLFNIRDKNIDKEQVIFQLTNRLPNLSKPNDIKTMSYLLEYLNKGGSIIPKIPAKKDIVNEIKNKRPIIALLTTNFLQGKTIFNFHYNVIIGVDDDRIIVNDPRWENEHGGQFSYHIDEFLFALYSSSLGDLDNASLLLIKN